MAPAPTPTCVYLHTRWMAGVGVVECPTAVCSTSTPARCLHGACRGQRTAAVPRYAHLGFGGQEGAWGGSGGLMSQRRLAVTLLWVAAQACCHLPPRCCCHPPPRLRLPPAAGKAPCAAGLWPLRLPRAGPSRPCCCPTRAATPALAPCHVNTQDTKHMRPYMAARHRGTPLA